MTKNTKVVNGTFLCIYGRNAKKVCYKLSLSLAFRTYYVTGCLLPISVGEPEPGAGIQAFRENIGRRAVKPI